MSLSCALWATSLHQWARRYLRQSQPSRCNPEKRARMRAFFAEGVDNMHIPWAVEGLPTLLHLSLFLFFGGLAIFLFDVDRDVFRYVVWWIGLFCLVYGVITVLPLIRQDSPYNSPLSTPAWYLHAAMSYVAVKILPYVTKFCTYIWYFSCCCCCCCFCGIDGLGHTRRLMDAIITPDELDSAPIDDSEKHYRRRMLGGVEKAAEEAVSKQLSKIDVRILDWTITTLGDDDSLKNFFEAIPGFFNSKLVKHLRGGFPEELCNKYRETLMGFVDRTLSSNSASDSEKVRRLDISMNAMSWIDKDKVSSILYKVSYKYWDEVPHTLEMGQSLARWCTRGDGNTASYAHFAIARILASVQERNGIWITLASRFSGLPEKDLRENVALGDDSVLLAILIRIAHQHRRSPKENVLEAFSKFDIRHTLPELQHDFCALWNEIVQDARKRGSYSNPVVNLERIRHLYIALHEGTDAAPTAFSASTDKYDVTRFDPSSYPLCNLASHRSDSIAQTPVPDSLQVPLPTQPAVPTDDGNTPSGQAEQVKNVTESPSPSNPATTSDIGATSHGPDMTPPTNPVHTSSRPTGASSSAVVSPASQDITSTDTQSHPPEGSEQQTSDIVAPSTEPETNQILSTASIHLPTPTLPPIPTSQPNSDDTCVTSASDSSHFAPPSIRSSIPASRPTGSATLLRLRARGLVNTRNICFANAVLQLLVNLPPSRNPLTELCDLKGKRSERVSETGGGGTPLVDATVRFFKEFMVEEESPSMQQQSPPATGKISRADEEKEDVDVVDSFEPTYLYDAIKEKRQLKSLLVRFRAHIATSRF